MDVSVVNTRPEHIESLTQRLRAQDVAEMWASYHLHPKEGLELSFQHSLLCWTVLLDDLPIIIFGVAPYNETDGAPWMLASPEIEKIKLKFLRHSRFYIDLMLEKFPYLENYVDIRNSISINWLTWCGFTIHDPEPYGIDQSPFHRFSKRRV